MEKNEYYKHICACGCGSSIEVKSYHKCYKIPIYLQGHNRGKVGIPQETRVCANSVCYNTFKCPITSKQKSCSLSCKPVWNRGLTKEVDGRVASKLVGLTFEEIHGEDRAKEIKEKLRKTNTGKHNSDESIQKNRIASLKMWGSLGHREKCVAKLLELFQDPEFKKKHFNALPKGSNHYNWKGGISNQPYPWNFNEKLKKLIRERDGHVCQLCSRTREEEGRELSVHHIDYIKENIDLENLITLCLSCNNKVNFNRVKWIKFFRSRKMLGVG